MDLFLLYMLSATSLAPEFLAKIVLGVELWGTLAYSCLFLVTLFTHYNKG